MNSALFPQPASLNGYQTLFGGCSVQESIRLETGNLVRKLGLISVATIGPALAFGLTYNSLKAADEQGFGYGWVHNWQAKIVPSGTAPVYVDEQGREFTFKVDGAGWALDEDDSLFEPIQLTSLSGSQWRINYFPDGEILEFDSSGRCLRRGDTYGNLVEASYNGGGQLTQLQEVASGVSSGRIISLSYASNSITVTDPRGQDYVLDFDVDQNLVSMSGPEGCVSTFVYDDPGNHLITGRIDPIARDPEESPLVDQQWSYTFDEDGRLETVTDSRGVTLTYTYLDDYEEATGYYAENFAATRLTDGNAKDWLYVFDRTGNLRRMIDPNVHQVRMAWSPQSRLLYEASGYTNWDPFRSNPHDTGPFVLGIRDQTNMRFRRNVYDSRGNLLQAVDGNGLLTHYEYASDRLVAVTPGRANFSVQGHWMGHFGEQGYMLCGATGSADLADLPAYIAAVTAGTGSVEPRIVAYETSYQGWRADSRCAHYVDPSNGAVRKAEGCWKSSLDGSGHPYRRFQFRLEMAEEADFNLSLYTNAVDLKLFNTNDLCTFQQSGYDLELLVTDSVGTQALRIPNNQNGVWATFPVKSAGEDVLVEVRARGNDNSLTNLDPIGDAVLSAIAFDSYSSRTTRMTYNSQGQVLTVEDPLGNITEYTYNGDGTLASSLEPGHTQPTAFIYGDAYKNLTRITDPLGGETNLTYDLNGNVLSVQDPDGSTTLNEYDGKNRLVRVQNALAGVSVTSFDAAGRVVMVEDAKGQTTAFAYKHQRLWKVTDALAQVTTLAYTNAGYLESLTDPRGEITIRSYDAANQLSQVTSPDESKVTYAYDSLGRVAAVTDANGNQADPAAMNLEGAKNILFNPQAQEVPHYNPNQYTSPPGEMPPRYWTGYLRGVDSQGKGYFPLDGYTSRWDQVDVPASAGGRYVASFVARKLDATPGSTVRMEFLHRLHKDFPGATHQKYGPTLVTPSLEPTSTSAEESERTVIELPGDAQASMRKPLLSKVSVVRDSGSALLAVDEVRLQRLSTCLEYDGENLRDICSPDGARQRIEYDRFGRAYFSLDSCGRSLTRFYDSRDRVVQVKDSLGNQLFFEYNASGDMVLFRLRSQGVDQDTLFDFDELHRLTEITYPDLSTEVFGYTAAGDLETYQDNMSQTHTYGYDALHRLVSITYADSTSVTLSYDELGNVLRVEERSGDSWTLAYDALSRLVLQVYRSGTESRGFVYRYNEVGQRMAVLEAPIYGVSRYGDALTPVWSIPSGGRDEMGRLTEVADVADRSDTLAYDVNGRLSQLTHANGIEQLYRYDITGKLLGIEVTDGITPLMRMDYRYNLSGDRLAQLTEQDSFIYLTDGAGRLVEESRNRFSIHQPEVWAQGQWESVHLDPSDRCLRLVELQDDFSGQDLQASRWRVENRQNSGYNAREMESVGFQCRQSDGLHMAYPRGFIARTRGCTAMVDDFLGQELPEYYSGYSGDGNQDFSAAQECWVQLRHAAMLSGDFDIAVDWEGLEWIPYASNSFFLQLLVTPAAPNSFRDSYSVEMHNNQVYRWVLGYAGYYIQNWPGIAMGERGQLRLARTGSSYTAYCRELETDSWITVATFGGTTDPVRPYLVYYFYHSLGSVTFKNYRHLDGKTHASLGTFVSPIYDAGRVVNWDRIQWTENLPSGCNVELEVCLADDWEEFENRVSPPAYFGPTGGGKFTNPAGEALPTGKTGRYAMVRATLTGNGAATPELSDIQLSCNSSSDVGSVVVRYTYDEAGNLLRVTTVDDSGSTEDVRDDAGWSTGERINSLNQIMRQDVGGDTWTFSYDLNGNMTEKTNGSDSWIYSWNDENRLIRVQGPGSVDVAYSYDQMGRMLTRDDGGPNVTQLVWDGWECVREVAGSSITTYCIPEGQLLSFIRDGERFDCHCDALLSIRMVTDESGDVVLRREFDAWGNELAGSFDSVPGGMPYGFVGALGVRYDSTTGLHYMRQRWYDSSLGRFISRDPVGLRGGKNMYSYARNNPVKFVDPDGLAPTVKDVTSSLLKILQRPGDYHKYLPCAQKMLKENRVIIDLTGDVPGYSDTPGEIHLNKGLSLQDATFWLFHEILHKGTGFDDGTKPCQCMPKDLIEIFHIEYVDNRFKSVRDDDRHRSVHAWIYWETNRLFKDTVAPPDRSKYHQMDHTRFLLDDLLHAGKSPDFSNLADELENLGIKI